tara:strand:- start:83 stop:436 length:354 start_codon:yes stop_codon:yes gene_type:complete
MEVKGDYQNNQSVQQQQVEKNKNLETTQTDKAEHNKTSQKTNSLGYKTSFSDKYEDYQKSFTQAFEIAKGTSPVREDKVRALKAKIESGNYEIDSGKIADGMLKEAIKDFLAESSKE